MGAQGESFPRYHLNSDGQGAVRARFPVTGECRPAVLWFRQAAPGRPSAPLGGDLHRRLLSGPRTAAYSFPSLPLLH